MTRRPLSPGSLTLALTVTGRRDDRLTFDQGRRPSDRARLGTLATLVAPGLAMPPLVTADVVRALLERVSTFGVLDLDGLTRFTGRRQPEGSSHD